MFEGLSEYLAGLYNQGGHINNTEVDSNTTTTEDISDDRASNTGQSLAISSSQLLPRVELVRLLTDVSGLVREKSQFTQYLNFSYSLSKECKPVVMEVLSVDETHKVTE